LASSHKAKQTGILTQSQKKLGILTTKPYWRPHTQAILATSL
jgi:hypothetical protein